MSISRTHFVALTCLMASVQFAAAAGGTTFCGTETGAPEALKQKVQAMAGIKEIHRDRDFVAFQDPASSTVYTFSEAANAAHPAAICRKPVQKGDVLEIEMAIVCKGPEAKCATLDADFKLLNAKMQADINNQIQAGRK